jgi:hypothetical protein
MLKSTDPTWAIANAMYWSVIETNIGILAASIPSYKALAKRYLPVLLGEYSSRNRYPSKGTPGGSTGPFQKITSANKSVQLRSLEHNKSKSIPTERELYHGKGDITTNVGGDSASNTSEEELTVPSGRIVAHTQIQTSYDTRNSDHLNTGRSFYIH